MKIAASGGCAQRESERHGRGFCAISLATRTEILHAAFAVEPEQRLSLTREIVSSIESEGQDVPEAERIAMWADEVERRHREVEQGKVKMIPWEEVKVRARAILLS